MAKHGHTHDNSSGDVRDDFVCRTLAFPPLPAVASDRLPVNQSVLVIGEHPQEWLVAVIPRCKEHVENHGVYALPASDVVLNLLGNPVSLEILEVEIDARVSVLPPRPDVVAVLCVRPHASCCNQI